MSTPQSPLFVKLGAFYDSFLRFLGDSLAKFMGPVKDFDPSQSCGKSTVSWVAANLQDVELYVMPGTINDEYFGPYAKQYRKWILGEDGMPGPTAVTTKIRKMPPDSKVPRSEQDCVCAFVKAVISPLVNELFEFDGQPSALENSGWIIPGLPYELTRELTKWLNDTQNSLKNLIVKFTTDWNMEMPIRWIIDTADAISGATAPPPPATSPPPPPPPPAQLPPPDVSTPAAAEDKKKKDKKEQGVRVDGLFSTRIEVVKNAAGSTQQSQLLAAPKGGSKKAKEKTNPYLATDTPWDMNNAEILSKVMGVLPIEFKNYGILNYAYMIGAASSEMAMADRFTASDLPQEDKSKFQSYIPKMRGIYYVMHQALHYCARYGTRITTVSDYKSLIVLKVPDGWKFIEGTSRLDTSADPNAAIWWMHINALEVVSDEKYAHDHIERARHDCVSVV
ncbi:hypothetical protein AURDEDRAFT_163127 [Auricularia subglabra TFB-10046 SS5]|nr:hypothetical protein AURDEDRAFT_163127 [Auricularia subglabra TFB-10046 SS5]